MSWEFEENECDAYIEIFHDFLLKILLYIGVEISRPRGEEKKKKNGEKYPECVPTQ